MFKNVQNTRKLFEMAKNNKMALLIKKIHAYIHIKYAKYIFDFSQ